MRESEQPGDPPPLAEGEGCQGPALDLQLRSFFDGLTRGPCPERLLLLAEQLEAAFERGELRCARSAHPRRGNA